MDMHIDTAEPGLYTLDVRSATRPSQPVAEPLVGRPDCHDACWSECENRPSGVCTVLFLYCVSVVG